LRKLLREMLRDDQLMAPFSGPVIERTLWEFDCGRGSHESRLWGIVVNVRMLRGYDSVGSR